MAMVEPWETQTGITVKYTGTRDINAVLTTGVASGILPDLAGLPGPGQMAEFAKERRAEAARRRPRHGQAYKAETAPALVALGRSTASSRRLHQGRRQGPDLVQPQGPRLRGGAADDVGRPQLAGRRANQGDAKATWCVGLESGAAPAGRAPTGSRTSSSARPAPTSTTSGCQGKLKWTSPEIKSAFEAFGKASSSDAYGGRRPSLDDDFGNGGDPLFKTPARLRSSTTRRASSPASADVQGAAKAGTDYDFFPFPDINPQFAGAVDRRRRPVRHVPRHAAGQVADEVPRHRRGPGHLGRRPAARCRPTRTVDELPGRHREEVGGRCSRTPRSSASTARTDADRDERRVPEGRSSTSSRTSRSSTRSWPTSTRSRRTPTRG